MLKIEFRLCYSTVSCNLNHHHHHHLRSPCLTRVGIRIALFHSSLSHAISSVKPCSFRSLLTTASHVCSGLPLPSFTSLSILHTFFTTSPSPFLITCPKYRNLHCASLSSILSTPRLPLIYSFLTLSLFVTPHIILSIFISVTFTFCSWLFFRAQHSAEYSITGLTTVL